MLNDKALVVFSGGQDSTTCLFWAKQQYKEVEAVTFNYNQRHKLEIEVAEDIAAELGIKHTVLDMGLLNQLAPNALTRDDIEISHTEGQLPSTFVPGRNLVFLTFAAILAKQIGARHIITGVCETDFSGYPDCRDVFIKSLNVTLNLSMDEQFVLHTPLMWLNKAETWQLADQLSALDFIKNKTLTCYNGVIADGCGECPACILGKKALMNTWQKRMVSNMYGFRIVRDLQKIDKDIKKNQLKYHNKRVLVSKEFTFDAAHHLHCYEGKCKNLHGHTYKVIFGVSGFVDETGLMMDFGDIKDIWKSEIEIHLDHRYLNETLPPMNTTAENMVVWIYEKMQSALKSDERQKRYSGARVEFVRLYETPTSYAEARREWMEIE